MATVEPCKYWDGDLIIPTTPVGEGEVIVSDLVPIDVDIDTVEYAVDCTLVPEITTFNARG